MGWFFNGKCRSKARMDGKTIIVTGSNTGIGKVTATELARRGGRVIMACRDTVKGETAKDEINKSLSEDENCGEIVVKKLDLSSFASVRSFAKDILDTEQYIHILINNAGVMMCPRSISEDGFELHFATNHLGHFLLTMLLLPKVIASAPARILNVSSKIHIITSTMSFDDINLEKGYKPVVAYGRSKLANILFSRVLAKKLEGKGVNVYSLHPGVVDTELSRHIDSAFFRGSRWLYHKMGSWFMKSPEQGAQTTLYCALEESLASKTGLYYDDCQESGTSSAAQDDKAAQELWEKSVEFVQLGSDDPFKA